MVQGAAGRTEVAQRISSPCSGFHMLVKFLDILGFVRFVGVFEVILVFFGVEENRVMHASEVF